MIVAFSGLDGAGKIYTDQRCRTVFFGKELYTIYNMGQRRLHSGNGKFKSIIRFFKFNGVPNEKGNSAARDEYFKSFQKKSLAFF